MEPIMVYGSQVVEMYISGTNKLGYINGDLLEPLPTDPQFWKWKTKDLTVKGWLINSMNEDISPNFMLYPTAKSMWDAVRRRYSDLENSTQMCDLRDTARNLKQGDLSVTQYFNTLTTLWQELVWNFRIVYSYFSDFLYLFFLPVLWVF